MTRPMTAVRSTGGRWALPRRMRRMPADLACLAAVCLWHASTWRVPYEIRVADTQLRVAALAS